MLVLRPGALGDTLLAVPALRALRRAFGSLTLAAHPGAARLLAALGEIDRGLPFDDPSFGWLFTSAARSEPYVAWTSLSRTDALVMAPSRPPLQDQHCARYLLQTLAPLGIDLTWDDSPFEIRPFNSEDVLIHPGSGAKRKNWPAERFAALIDALAAPVRLIVGEADGDAADDVERQLGHGVPRLTNVALHELASRLAGCQAYVGNDSGVSHLAGLCGAHTLAVFGPTDPRVWSPIGPRVQVVPFDTDPLDLASAV